MPENVQPGEPLKRHFTADWFNKTLQRVETDKLGRNLPKKYRPILCVTTEDIAAAEIDTETFENSVYYAGTVNVWGLNRDDTKEFSPGEGPLERLMINPGTDLIPSGTPLWGIEYLDGILLAFIWPC